MKRLVFYTTLGAEIQEGVEPEVYENTIGPFADERLNECMEIAKTIAYNGEITVEEVADPETPDTPTGDDSIWDELDAAYQEGVDSV